MALVSAPAAFGANDPIASGSFNFTISNSFKHQLKRNHVKMRPKRFSIGDGSSLQPVTGEGLIRLPKIKFIHGDEKFVYKNVKVYLPAAGQGAASIGGIRSSIGKIFKLQAGSATLTRDGFGASVTGIGVKFWKGAATKLNRNFHLHSVKGGPGGTLSVSEQPQTVEVKPGTCPPSAEPGSAGDALRSTDSCLIVDPTQPTEIGGPSYDAVPQPVANRLRFHCIDATFGIEAIQGANGLPIQIPFEFPATGGTISPAGTDGVPQFSGGLRLETGLGGFIGEVLTPKPVDCPQTFPGRDTSTSWIEQTNFAPNLGELNVQGGANIGGTNPGCWSSDPNQALADRNPPNCGVFPGDKGVAIAFTIDPSNVTVSADPNAHTVTYKNAVFKLNGLSALVLGQGVGPAVTLGNGASVSPGLGLFPNAACTQSPPHSGGICQPVGFGGTPGPRLRDCDPGATCATDPAHDFAEGDLFGVASIQVQVR